MDGPIQACGDTRAGDMKTFCGLTGGEALVHTQVEDFAVGARQHLDHFRQQGQQFLFLSESFRTWIQIDFFARSYFAAPHALAADILGRIGDDTMYPRASLGAVEAGVIDGLEDLDPTHPRPGGRRRRPAWQGAKSTGSSRCPCFGIAFEEGAVLDGVLESGMLPPGPATPEDESRSLVVGEAHHPNET